MGTIGLAAGIASGDPSKAIQYGALGLGAGAMAGSNLVNATGALADKGVQTARSIPQGIRNLQDEYHQNADNAEEYKAYKEQKQLSQKERAMKEFRKNDTALAKAFTKSEARRIMDEALPDYFDQNITNGKEIAAIEKYRAQIMEQNSGVSEEQARRQAMQEFRVNKELKSRGVSKHKDKVEEIRGRLEKSGMNKDAATAEAERMISAGNTMNDNIANM